jgi:amino acid adenylation domain-containing protein
MRSSASPLPAGGTIDAVEDGADQLNQSERLSSEFVRSGRTESIEHWQRALSGVEPLAFPTDRPRARASTESVAFESSVFPAEIADCARRFADVSGTTPSIVLLAAFCAVLHRQAQKSELVVCLAAQNREGEPASELDDAFLPIRIRMDVDASFADLVAVVNAAWVEASVHSPLPSEVLSSLLGASSTATASLIEVAFEHRGLPTHGRDAAHSGVEMRRANGSAMRCELGLVLSERDESSGVQFNTDLFDPATARRLFGHYVTLLKDALDRPDAPVVRLSVLTDDERDALIGYANAAFDAPKATVPVHVLIERRAVSTPDAVAVSDGARTLSYRELIDAARGLSARLAGTGVRSGSRVLLYMERSTDLVVALLAILGSGAAYVPVDPRHPVTRAESILDDAAPDCVLVHSHLRDRLRLRPGTPLVTLDVHGAALDATEASQFVSDTSLPAYVLYTSGSTGRPKGVVVPVSALNNLLAAMARTPGMSPADRLLSVTTITFDIAALEIFLPLVCGASVHLAQSDVVVDGPRLRELCDTVRPTVLQATPATFRLLVEAGWNGSEDLSILCGGEALPRDLAESLLLRAKAVFNVYGPTETTIWSTLHPVQSGEGPVPIGRAIDRTRTYVVDRHLQLVPVGVPGELCIGGDGVASGYLNRPELTAERFVEDPFAHEEGARLYRTGDLARLRADGVLEYLGRLDDQIKLRGFRIEPGEVELALKDTGLVASAVAVARQIAPGDVRLLAYYVPLSAPVDPVELREALRPRLPEYMIPSFFVPVGSWPLTSSGKIDRKALPAPHFAHASSAVPQVTPSDELERFIASVWSEALSVPVVGVRDDFFSLGGHSLLALRILVKLEKKYGVPLPIRALLDSPTVESLADSIRSARAAARVTGSPRKYRSRASSFEYLVPLQSGGDGPPLVCVHGVGGNVMNLSFVASYFAGIRPFWGVQARGTDGLSTPLTRIEDMAAAYLEELVQLQPRGPYYLGGYSGGGVVAFEIAQRLRRAGEEVAFLGLIDTYRPGAYRMPHRLDWLSRERMPNHTFSLGYLASHVKSGVIRNFSEASFSASIAWRRVLGLPVPHELRKNWVGRELLKAIEDYNATVYDGRVVLFRAAKADKFHLSFEQLGWDGLAAKGIEVVHVPGDHDSLALEPNAKVLAQRLLERL